MPFRPVVFALLLALAPSAQADETPAPSPSPSVASPQPSPPFDSKEVETLTQFGLAHAECAEWSDGCAVCQHDGPAKTRCSLPGIACQPVDIACRKP